MLFRLRKQKQKKTKNMLSDNRALVENNYHKYAVIMLVKTHITKKLRMAVDKKKMKCHFFHPVVGTIFHFTGIHV